MFFGDDIKSASARGKIGFSFDGYGNGVYWWLWSLQAMMMDWYDMEKTPNHVRW
jgi:hypothetical protein